MGAALTLPVSKRGRDPNHGHDLCSILVMVTSVSKYLPGMECVLSSGSRGNPIYVYCHQGGILSPKLVSSIQVTSEIACDVKIK